MEEILRLKRIIFSQTFLQYLLLQCQLVEKKSLGVLCITNICGYTVWSQGQVAF